MHSYAPEARCGLQRRHRRSAGHIFSVLAEKIWKKRPLERFYSAVAPEPLTFGLFAWLASLPQPIETAEQKRAKPESLCTDSGQMLFDFAGTNIYRSEISDSRNSAARPKGVLTTETKRHNAKWNDKPFQARKRDSVLQRLFSPHSFLARQKRMGRRRQLAPPAQKRLPLSGASFTRKVIHMWMWTVYKFSVHNCATDVSQNCLWTDLISAHIGLWTNNR